MRNSQPKRPAGSPHFSDAEWADYARGLASPSLRLKIQAHLDSACESCRTQLAFLQQVVHSAAPDAVSVPDELVLRAQALFDRPAPRNWMQTLQALTAELISRSPLELHPAGVRSLDPGVQAEPGERLLFRAGVYLLDLKVDSSQTSGATEIIGQISNPADDNEILDDVLVQVDISGRIVLETPANRFGEFLLVHPLQQNRAILRLGLRKAGLRIDVPLRARRGRSRPV